MSIEEPPTLVEMWRNASAYVQVLAISGIAGAVFRTCFAPREEMKRRIVQGIGGSLSAIFLGGALAHIIDAMTGADIYAYSASGFIMGTGGQVAVRILQERLLGSVKK